MKRFFVLTCLALFSFAMVGCGPAKGTVENTPTGKSVPEENPI